VPVTEFLHPLSETGERVPFVDAAEVFEREGLIPRAHTLAMIADLSKDRGPESGLYLYPSCMNPDTTCRRELVIQRFLPQAVSPFAVLARMEGTLWHNLYAAQDVGAAVHEERYPTKGATLCLDGKRRVEVWPGVLLSTRVDLLEPGRLIDYKSRKYPRVYGKSTDPDEKGPFFEDLKRDWGLQLNLTKFVVEACPEAAHMLPINDLAIWRCFLGSHDSSKTFRYIPITSLSKETVWAQIGSWTLELLDMLQRAYEVRDDLPKLEALIETIPPDGHNKGMFGAKKCLNYCDSKPACPLFKESMAW
jgi:hypothetical protein